MYNISYSVINYTLFALLFLHMDELIGLYIYSYYFIFIFFFIFFFFCIFFVFFFLFLNFFFFFFFQFLIFFFCSYSMSLISINGAPPDLSFMDSQVLLSFLSFFAFSFSLLSLSLSHFIINLPFILLLLLLYYYHYYIIIIRRVYHNHQKKIIFFLPFLPLFYNFKALIWELKCLGLQQSNLYI